MGRIKQENKPVKYQALENEDVLENLVINFINSYPRKGGNDTRGSWKDEVLEARNMLVINKVRNGFSRQRIKEYIMQNWGVSHFAADKYYKEAIESLEIESDAVKNAARKIAVERLNDIITRARERGNTDSELKALEQLNKINGLYSEKKEVEITGLQFDFGERE